MGIDLESFPAMLLAVHVYVPRSLLDTPFMNNFRPSVPVFFFKSLLWPVLLHVNDGGGTPEASQVKVRFLPMAGLTLLYRCVIRGNTAKNAKS